LWNSGGEASEEKILVGGKRRWVAGRRKEYIKSKETPDLRVNTRGNQRKSMKIMENTLPLLVAWIFGGEGRRGTTTVEERGGMVGKKFEIRGCWIRSCCVTSAN
jgi:hypothetical protein